MSSRTQSEDSLDSAIPPWKRELILRRRALLARTHGGIPTPGSGGALNSAAASLLVAGHSGAVKTAAAAFSAISGDRRSAESRPGGSGGVKCSAMKLEGLECDDAVTISRMNGGKDGPTAAAIADGLPVKGGRNNRLPPSGDVVGRRAGVGRAGSRRKSSKGSPTAPDEDDDEELRYGPGIVHRLRSKYLSMTLRESQTRGVRPSLSSLRRAASMEDILDGPAQQPSSKESRGVESKPAIAQKVGRYTKRAVAHRPPLNLPPEALKRARSVETLLQCELKSPVSGLLSPTLAKEDVIIIEGGAVSNKEEVVSDGGGDGRRAKKPSGLAEEELPPPDVVRQTLKIFEYSSPPTSPGGGNNKKAPSTRASANGVSTSSVVVRATPAVAIPPQSPPHGPKPQLSPKPVILQMSGPKSNLGPAVRVPPQKLEHESPKKVVKPLQDIRPSVLPIAAPKASTSPMLPPTVKGLGMTTLTQVAAKKASPNKPFKTSPSTKPLQRSSPTEAKPPSPAPDAVSPVPNGQVAHEKSSGVPGSRTVSRSALENIRKDGLSMEFKFDGAQKPKTHLPGGSPSQVTTVQGGAEGVPRQVGIIRPMTKPPTPPGATVRRATPPRSIAPLQSTASSTSTTSGASSPTPDVVKSALTETEKEKNHINRVKSTEGPIRKVNASPPKLVSPPAGATKLVTVVKEVPSVSKVEPAKLVQLKKPEDTPDKTPVKTGLWDSQSRWNEQQNSVIFNFVARSNVPDYIENDGLIIRPRDRPRRNEPGSIWLRDSTRGESTDDDDEEDDEEDATDAFGWVSSDPPPPCNVHFEGDNVLINGRSNLRKNSAAALLASSGPSPGGSRKLHITFNDEATKTFEYPSESSFMDESPLPVPQATALSSGSSLVHTPPPSSMTPSLATTEITYVLLRHWTGDEDSVV
ncbi:uncharacterized protein bif isoform X2 [Hetaerina americana]|uniref:uncharacterized protein bif isoform X2 n=1 Tax=Hetaerina americana TaxID=62018 RepID=UPI003A7F240E